MVDTEPAFPENILTTPANDLPVENEKCATSPCNIHGNPVYVNSTEQPWDDGTRHRIKFEGIDSTHLENALRARCHGSFIKDFVTDYVSGPEMVIDLTLAQKGYPGITSEQKFTCPCISDAVYDASGGAVTPKIDGWCAAESGIQGEEFRDATATKRRRRGLKPVVQRSPYSSFNYIKT